MKKNITINIFGALYAIDEDAYRLLEDYLANMKTYFSSRPGGDEITDDIEHRVAEILNDLKASGVEAIDIEHVSGIIERIGNPEQLARDADLDNEEAAGSSDAAPSAAAPADPQQAGSRRLFRDPDDVVFGGVISGVCKYFGASDPLPWRLLAVVLMLMSFSVFAIVYLVAWAIVPQAQTAEDRLRMTGRPVTPENIINETMSAVRSVPTGQIVGRARGFFETLLRVFAFLIKVLLLVFFAFWTVGHFLLCLAAGWVLVAQPERFQRDDEGWCDFVNAFNGNGTLITEYILFFVFGMVFLCIVMYGLVRWISGRSSVRPASPSRRTLLLVVAIVSFAVASLSGFAFCALSKTLAHEAYVKRNTVDGIYIHQNDRKHLNDEGWKVLAMKNCDSDGECFEYEDAWNGTGDCIQVLHFEKEDARKPMEVHFSKAQTLPAGDYRLAAIVASAGPGAYVYIKSAAGDSLIAVAEIPASSANDKGNLAGCTPTFAYAHDLIAAQLRPTTAEQQMCFQADSASSQINPSPVPPFKKELAEEMEEWSYVETPVFHHNGGPLTLGVTTMRSVVGKGNTVSASSDVHVRNIDVVAVK